MLIFEISSFTPNSQWLTYLTIKINTYKVHGNDNHLIIHVKYQLL